MLKNCNQFYNMQALPVFTFANQAGLDMLETTLVALQDITLEKIFDDNGKKTLCSEFPQIMQQVGCFEIHLKIWRRVILLNEKEIHQKAYLYQQDQDKRYCMKEINLQ